MTDQLAEFCNRLRAPMERGRVVPFLGAGAGQVGRPDEVADWTETEFLPLGQELADHLATTYAYPKDQPRDLAKVAQFADLVMQGEAELFQELRSMFIDRDHPNAIHELLAAEYASAHADGRQNPWPLIVTTNYDNSLERAFEATKLPFDVVTYYGEPNQAGRFRHRRPDNGGVKVIRKASQYRDFDLDRRPVILKVHGGVDEEDAAADSFVITEDHYLSYMVYNDLQRRLPPLLLETLRDCHFLFLGYALADWNVRVVLLRLWRSQKRRRGSWAIERSPRELDSLFWARHGVNLLQADLLDWAQAMDRTR
jgi:SIR2-like domain